MNTQPVEVQLHCRLTVTVDDPEAVTDLAVRQLREADIDWSQEEDDLETAAAELKADLLNSLAGVAEPDRMLDGVPGAEFTSGHIWAQLPTAGPAGSTDLDAMLGTLDATARPDEYVYVVLPPGHPLLAYAAATVTEDEGLTAVVLRADADAHDVPYDFVAAWLTLTVHSSLAAVGLTAAFSRVLGDAGISCNVLAGYSHDHILVPAPDRDRAIEALRSLRDPASPGPAPQGA